MSTPPTTVAEDNPALDGASLWTTTSQRRQVLLWPGSSHRKGFSSPSSTLETRQESRPARAMVVRSGPSRRGVSQQVHWSRLRRQIPTRRCAMCRVHGDHRSATTSAPLGGRSSKSAGCTGHHSRMRTCVACQGQLRNCPQTRVLPMPTADQPASPGRTVERTAELADLVSSAHELQRGEIARRPGVTSSGGSHGAG